MNEELKPCPFCGGEARLIEPHDEYEMFRVECTNLECNLMPFAYGIKERVIDEWNTRFVRTGYMHCVKDGPIYDVWRFTCCGFEFAENRCDAGVADFDPKFCPYCGARVVVE